MIFKYELLHNFPHEYKTDKHLFIQKQIFIFIMIAYQVKITRWYFCFSKLSLK